MITQIIIKEDRDLGISNNWGQPEPFQSAVKAQMFNPLPFDAIDDLSNQRIINSTFIKHIRQKWNNLPRLIFRALDAHTIVMIQELDKLKNNF